MPCPFPGMDPYLERPVIWADFHDSLIIAIRGLLQPLLRPKYAALTQDRLYVVESDRPIYPDVAVVETSRPAPGPRTAALLTPDAPVVFELWREEIREPLIHIIEPAAGNRLVTSIEVLSPKNKNPGEGRAAYLKKREEYWLGGVSLMEIDLLRAGETTVRLSPEKMAELPAWTYLVGVTRRWPSRQEMYPIPLARKLPCVSVPLSATDADVSLDLQAAFKRAWDEGAYPELLRYEGTPPGLLHDEDFAWCEAQLTQAGFRKS